MMPLLDGNHSTPLMMGLIPRTDNSNEGNTDLTAATDEKHLQNYI